MQLNELLLLFLIREHTWVFEHATDRITHDNAWNMGQIFQSF